MPITQKQKGIAARARQHAKNVNGKWRAQILANARKHNKYMDKK